MRVEGVVFGIVVVSALFTACSYGASRDGSSHDTEDGGAGATTEQVAGSEGAIAPATGWSEAGDTAGAGEGGAGGRQNAPAGAAGAAAGAPPGAAGAAGEGGLGTAGTATQGDAGQGGRTTTAGGEAGSDAGAPSAGGAEDAGDGGVGGEQCLQPTDCMLSGALRCGRIPDNCGAYVDCPECSDIYYCDSGYCRPYIEQPSQCWHLGNNPDCSPGHPAPEDYVEECASAGPEYIESCKVDMADYYRAACQDVMNACEEQSGHECYPVQAPSGYDDPYCFTAICPDPPPPVCSSVTGRCPGC